MAWRDPLDRLPGQAFRNGMHVTILQHDSSLPLVSAQKTSGAALNFKTLLPGIVLLCHVLPLSLNKSDQTGVGAAGGQGGRGGREGSR